MRPGTKKIRYGTRTGTAKLVGRSIISPGWSDLESLTWSGADSLNPEILSNTSVIFLIFSVILGPLHPCSTSSIVTLSKSETYKETIKEKFDLYSYERTAGSTNRLSPAVPPAPGSHQQMQGWRHSTGTNGADKQIKVYKAG